MIKAIKAIILSLALLIPSGVTALNVGTPPPKGARIGVNTCNGAVLNYKAPFAYGVTATHCVKAPMDLVRIDMGETWAFGTTTRTDGDMAFIRWQQGEKPENMLPLAQHLPKPGDIVWIAAVINGDYLPVPAVWLGTEMVLGEISSLSLYGMVAAGFSGSPVINDQGEIFGIVSLGSFIDSHNETSIIAPWAGISVFEHLREK